jgi:ribosomal protein L40E
MKYCYNCKVRYPDTFTFCTRCGASFDVKLCRKLHPNPRHAEYCRVCGSSDLSTPHNRPGDWRTGIIVATAGALLTVFVALLWVLGSAGKDDGIRSAMVLLGWFKERYR